MRVKALSFAENKMAKKKPNVPWTFGLHLVPRAGLEPARLAAGDFESPESTNFTTWAGIL